MALIRLSTKKPKISTSYTHPHGYEKDFNFLILICNLCANFLLNTSHYKMLWMPIGSMIQLNAVSVTQSLKCLKRKEDRFFNWMENLSYILLRSDLIKK